ncbi:MAG: diguanylate cyclase [Cyanobacteria bacterium]|nr:diguanylate cyclase [Cyanobacteriota bacterium]
MSSSPQDSSSSGSKSSKHTHLLNRFLTLLLAGLIGFAIFATIMVFHLDDLIEDLEKKTYDLRVSLPFGGNPQHKPSDNIVIVEFDDPTFKALSDEYGVWPWPRNVHAEMIEYMNGAGAKALAYDIMFVANRKGSEENDQKLIDAFRKFHNVYLSMNFDNDKWIVDQLGKGLTPSDIDRVRPLSVNLSSRLSSEDGEDGLNTKKGFFENDAMNFNSFRPILGEFLDVKERVAFINHGRDKDGVSRSNPLIFRFGYVDALRSANRPFVKQLGTSGFWKDSKGERVNAEGVYLNADGTPRQTKMAYDYYPYLGLKLLMDLKGFKNQEIILTQDGHLQFPGYDIPLLKKGSTAGSYLINWYNVNVDEEEMKHNLQQLQLYRQEILNRLETASFQAQPGLKNDLAKIDGLIAHFKTNLERTFEARPYKQISAWEIIRALRNEKEGKTTDQDRLLKKRLKDKIIFVGTTAVSTYDIKTTPINKLLPGVVLQATIFDNLYQNKFYMRRADTSTNFLLQLLMCVLAAVSILKMRSAVSGLLTSLATAALYVALSVFALKYLSLWVNIAMPFVALTITTIITFMVKYMNRDQDYKKTYKLATTDGLTGLYNHRYFQEHLAKCMDYSQRFNTKFSLILVDIDFFKKFNDTYGHQAGDEVLRQVARKLRNSVRTVDLVARYGGEEMAIILEKADEPESLEVARKLVRLIAEEEYLIAEGVSKHVTVSVGVSTFPTHGKSPSELIEFSDRGLYRAKENGRNQVGAQFDSSEGGPLFEKEDHTPIGESKNPELSTSESLVETFIPES